MPSDRKYLNQGTHAYAHIGRMVQQEMEAQKISGAEMARRMGVTGPTMAAYLKRPSIQAGILWKLGLALEYNFFAEMAQQFPAEMSKKVTAPLQLKLDEKDLRIADLEKEIAIYKNVISGFK